MRGAGLESKEIIMSLIKNDCNNLIPCYCIIKVPFEILWETGWSDGINRLEQAARLSRGTFSPWICFVPRSVYTYVSVKLDRDTSCSSRGRVATFRCQELTVRRCMDYMAHRSDRRAPSECWAKGRWDVKAGFVIEKELGWKSENFA